MYRLIAAFLFMGLFAEAAQAQSEAASPPADAPVVVALTPREERLALEQRRAELTRAPRVLRTAATAAALSGAVVGAVWFLGELGDLVTGAAYVAAAPYCAAGLVDGCGGPTNSAPGTVLAVTAVGLAATGLVSSVAAKVIESGRTDELEALRRREDALLESERQAAWTRWRKAGGLDVAPP